MDIFLLCYAFLHYDLRSLILAPLSKFCKFNEYSNLKDWPKLHHIDIQPLMNCSLIPHLESSVSLSTLLSLFLGHFNKMLKLSWLQNNVLLRLSQNI